MEYILSTAKKYLIMTDQTCPLAKNLNWVIAEALSIEDNILFNNKDEIKYLSIRQIRFTFLSLENVDYELE